MWRRFILFISLAAVINSFGWFLPLEWTILLLAVTGICFFAVEFVSPVYTSLFIIISLVVHLPKENSYLVVEGFGSSVILFLIGATALGLAVAHSTIGSGLLRLFKYFMVKKNGLYRQYSHFHFFRCQ
ncbi:hypothetical protein [Salsuginibacillus kocurii]|uniref:hypothetical protein n=1 Tax=Salsuginibacillus kocurii TaxID=427078 RepID=UPI0003750F41|nr:hypothetical protein [Salsuginibacillus kocurii]